MKSINPYDLKLIREYPEDSEESVQRKLELANSTFQQFRKSFFKERSEKNAEDRQRPARQCFKIR